MDLIRELKEGGDKTLQEAASNREVASILGQMALAKRFPRDLEIVQKKSLKMCENKNFCETAIYSIPRKSGNKSIKIEGPSIRLIEMITNNMGNINFGIQTIPDEFDKEATRYSVFAHDLESNTRVSRSFVKRHTQYTIKGGIQKVTNPQFVYELIANDSTRRLRVCLLNILPKWIVDECFEKCQQVNASAKLPNNSGQQEKILLAFKNYNVTRLELEEKIGKPLEKATTKDINELRSILNGLKNDGVEKTSYFPIS